ncbi:MAG: endopeptidase La [Oscillospiraceae bacterium]|nr:endopeptidase La [Oscillospiraceae bacterium]
MVEPGKYRLPCIATRDIVLFPNMTLHFDIARERSLNALNNAMKADRRIFLTAQKDIRVEEPTRSDVYNIGVVAQIKQVVKSDDRNVTRVFVEGICRGELEEMYVIDGDALECTTKLLPTYEKTQAEGEEITALMREVKRLFKSYTERVPRMPRELIVSVHTASDAQMLFENVAYNIFIPTPERQALLEAATVDDKLELLAAILGKEIEVMSIEKEIQDRVAVHFDKIQKEAYLREQLRIISDELGESYDELDELGEDDKYYNEILALGLGEEHQEKLLSELRRMRKMPPTSQEAALISEYLDTCIALPWHNASDETYDVVKAQKILDKDHYGLTKVKERILETIAVKQLSPEVRGQIICLYGPPGVGKTSIGKSIAKALGRKYVRVSLGGVNDEADVRGHRKTYIGAMPGRILDAIKRSGVNNPVMLLDEIDKLTSNTRGDPAAALLEALDSEQNKEFRDHYVEIPFDLSRVMFITTANELDTIPAPLLDRMEVIELSSYTREEKLNIAKKHLVPKQLRENGLKASQVKFTQSAIYKLIDSYTKEAGVRKLERQIASLCRKAAAKIVRGEAEKISFTEKNIKDFLGPEKIKPEVMAGRQEIGVVNGLAWTSAGGVLMPLEAIVLDGKGKVEATGSLGDVMKESATIAVSYCRSVAKQYGIDPEFYSKKDIHIHAPEGAVPKDGPSAGVTLVTALVSVLSGRPVRGDVAMTGEITLTGRVLPIGGLREKTMAAYKNGIKTVIIPMANKPDLDEVDEKVLEGMEFVFAERISDVLEKALVSQKGK